MDLEEMVNRYVITAAELGSVPNHKQLDAYETYSKQWGAELIVIPIEGQHRDGMLHERFDNYKVTTLKSLGKNIAIDDFRVRAQNINPLTGIRRFGAVDKSLIVGSPKQHLEHVANSAKHNPKAIMSTGVCTLPNYKQNTRIGNIAERDHTQGAILVEVEDNDYFHFRPVQSITDGSFVDLGYKYSADGKVQQVRADTLVWGDLHDYNKDMSDYNASLAMLQDVNPKHLILHDIFDGHSITHHDLNKSIVRADKANSGGLSLYNELYKLGETLEEIRANGPKDMQMHIVKSNHDEHLSRYLEECRYTGDPSNLELSVRLAHAMLEGKDPVKEGIKLTYGKLPKGIDFLQRDSEFNRYGWELGFHGDKGPNGSRGSMNSFEYSLSKAIIGHSHSANIRKNILRVGTLLRKDIDYAKGSPGSWTTTNAVVYPNRTAQLVNIYNGKYTA